MAVVTKGVKPMTQDNTKKKHRSSKKNTVPDELDIALRKMAKENLGRSLDDMLQQGSPLSELLGRFAQITLEEEMSAHLGYQPHERSYDEHGELDKGKRTNTRNGYSSKTLKTSQGEVEIDVPRDRDATFEPQIVPKHGSLSAELEAKVLSMYTHGMTTRNIQKHVREMYQVEVSGMFVSRVVERLEPELDAWRNRPLESVYPVVFIDAFHQKVRHSHGVVSTAFYLVCANNEQGKLDVLGLWSAPDNASPKESASFWHQVMLELQRRGVEEILMMSADGLSGIQDAVKVAFERVKFTRCVVHMVRNSLIMVSWKQRKEVAAKLRAIYNAPTYTLAEQALIELEDEYGERFPAIIKQWKKNLLEISDLWKYGPELRRLIYTTNAIENVNRQIRKTLKVRGAFPNIDSVLRLVTLHLMEREKELEARTKIRGDWRKICTELHFHFPDSLPEQWGLRYIGHVQPY